MNEIKPEHVTPELATEINDCLEVYDNLGGSTQDLVSDFCHLLQQHGFTVLKPGELCWIERNVAAFPKFKEWHAMSACHCYAVYESIANPNTFDISFVTIKNGHTIKKYLVPTLEDAKQFCQQLEDKARST